MKISDQQAGITPPLFTHQTFLGEDREGIKSANVTFNYSYRAQKKTDQSSIDHRRAGVKVLMVLTKYKNNCVQSLKQRC